MYQVPFGLPVGGFGLGAGMPVSGGLLGAPQDGQYPQYRVRAQARTYSLADQTARYARAQAERNVRYLDISAVYDGSGLQGQRVLITGANRGLGLAIARQLLQDGAQVIVVGRQDSPELRDLGAEVIVGVDVCD